MEKIVIEGENRLKGNVDISGSKNATLPILAATLLTDEKCVIENVPHLMDVITMSKILKHLGVRVHYDNGRVVVDPSRYNKCMAPYNLVSTMRASICVLGPLVARKKFAQVSLPGGCIIGPRPINLHLKGLELLGAKIKLDHGYIFAKGEKLKGNIIYLGGAFGSSVLATANVVMAATLTKGRTLIENAACEPEIVDLIEFLIKMGAKIKGKGSNIIEVEGVKRLGGANHKVIPDRIEAGTYMIAAAMTGGEVTLENARYEHLGAVIDKLTAAGVKIYKYKNKIRVKAPRRLRTVDVTTLPYPGFPTDLQAQMMALMSITDGISVITEKIYPERFMHISELNRMGAQIQLENSTAIVKGVKNLSGAPVMASDLRASAALVLAGLVAKGKTDISRIYHLDRGYDRLEAKLAPLGAKIWRVKE